jgi:hypothetical protein
VGTVGTAGTAGPSNIEATAGSKSATVLRSVVASPDSVTGAGDSVGDGAVPPHGLLEPLQTGGFWSIWQ